MDDETPIADLDLPGRTKVALIKKHYKTLGDLRGVALYSITGLGPRSAHAIRNLFAEVDGVKMDSELPSDPIADFYEVDRPATPDEHKYHVSRFLEWLVNHDDGIVLARSSEEGHQRHEFDPEFDFDILYRRFLDYEEDQGVAAMEAPAEQAYERSWGG